MSYNYMYKLIKTNLLLNNSQHTTQNTNIKEANIN